MSQPVPSRGDVWLIDFNPTRGRETAGIRPGVIVSADYFNRVPAGLAVVIPVTTRYKGVPLHVQIEPPDGGLRQRSYAKVEDIRSVDYQRLIVRWGTISGQTSQEIDRRLRLLLAL